MNGGKIRSKAWMLPPFLFFAGFALLVLVWALMEPRNLISTFDAQGRSVFELSTLPFYAAIIPFVWLKCPFGGSLLRRRILSLMVTIVVVMAIFKQLDLHNAALHALYPSLVGENGSLLPGLLKPNGNPLTGTPFKMRVITNGGVPLGMKAIIVFYFAAFFGVFAAGSAYLASRWIKGVFTLKSSAWAIGCMFASGVVVQISDRLPAWIRGATGKSMAGGDEGARALCTALEEGGEMMLAAFAIIAILYGARELLEKEKKNG